MKILHLASMVLAVTLLASPMLVGLTSSAGVYNPWYDLDDDGGIDIFDIVRMAGSYGTSGEPYEAKAAIEYDSGWVNITNQCGKYSTTNHNLNSTRIMVNVQGKTAINGGVHQKYYGLTGHMPEWSRTYSDLQSSVGRRLIQTRDGGFAFAFDTSQGAGLLKTDSIGNILWSKTYGLLRTSSAVVQTSDGGYVVVGEYYITSSNRDFWMVKTDSNGNKQWEKMFGGVGTEWAFSVTQTTDGGYAVAGDADSFSVSSDGWLVKTNSTGSIQWSRTYGGPSEESFRSLIQTNDGGYAMGGYTNGFFGNIWLVKTDSNGNMQWNYSYDNGNTAEVIQTSDGGYAMTGAFGSVNLVKTDADGVVQWRREYVSFDGAYSILGTSDGGYALAGYKFLNGTNPAISFVRTDISGNIEWSRIYDSPESNFASSMVQTTDGGFAILGSKGVDQWLIKTDVECGLAWTDSTANTLTLYRGATDPYWNFVRVRIWKVRDTP